MIPDSLPFFVGDIVTCNAEGYYGCTDVGVKCEVISIHTHDFDSESMLVKIIDDRVCGEDYTNHSEDDQEFWVDPNYFERVVTRTPATDNEVLSMLGDITKEQ